ncbi:hypothetical protein BJ138DRAFT_1119964 [Hygrophoropsis aurantiaca]|uniref:Uncharacterized protein n=1 Tax=Hygrophoropsis aurantiaca TaxID=72124 RepID=A0ACB7ZT51_9AGAM|nr:hypothetical protein BJ138DRAFT_1119964 [Hygrophoropsis aurantiaca]
MADPLLIQELQATQTSNYVIAVGGALVAYDQGKSRYGRSGFYFAKIALRDSAR